MSPTPEMLSNPQPKQNACGVCHIRMLGKDHVHGPAGVFECTFCHASDSQPNKYQARPGDAELCVECHDDKMDEYQQSQYVHGPVEAGMCLVCHDPHASDQPSQLVAPVNDLCLSCHSQVRNEKHVTTGPEGEGHPLSGGKNPANPLKNFSCASCHNPHAGNARALFNFGAKSRMGLCGKCHDK
jgi:predicted CXXCH cytochrome family protein